MRSLFATGYQITVCSRKHPKELEANDKKAVNPQGKG